MTYYRPDGDFKMKKLTDEQAEERQDLMRWSNRYGRLMFLWVPVLVVLLVMQLWLYAFLTYVLGNVASGVSLYYFIKAKQVTDE